MTVSIRKAAAGDVGRLHALIESAYRGDSARRGWTHEADLLGGQRTDVEALQESLSNPSQTILVAEDADGAFAGCVLVSDEGDGGAYLGMLSVDPERQAGGIGRTLIAAAEAHARDVLGADRMAMTVIRQRPELIAYYERRGYGQTGEERPFPLDDPRFGLPRTRDLVFVLLKKQL
jgi:ribosomal protein S18 acetylase RimI-like enzyme